MMSSDPVKRISARIYMMSKIRNDQVDVLLHRNKYLSDAIDLMQKELERRHNVLLPALGFELLKSTINVLFAIFFMIIGGWFVYGTVLLWIGTDIINVNEELLSHITWPVCEHVLWYNNTHTSVCQTDIEAHIIQSVYSWLMFVFALATETQC